MTDERETRSASPSLQQVLAEMMSVRPPSYRALLDELAARLRESALENVVKPGERLPDFILPDAEGNLVFSDALLAKGPVVVVFFRGDWCPFCKTTLTALDEILPDIRAAGANLVALTLDTGEYVDADWRGLQLRFPVLSDVDGGTALQFGTIYRLPDALRAFYEAIGIDIGLRHGEQTWFLPIPATFITDRDGIVRHVHASGDITDRMEPAEIVARLRELASEKP